MRKIKIDEAMLECYQLLYENSEPKADFKELIDKASFNEMGQKVIDYNSYEIEGKKLDEIVESILKKYKIKSYLKYQFRTSIYLGCSPKTKSNEN